MLYRAVRKHQPDGLFCSLPPMYFSQPGAVNGPEEAIWHENGKQTKCLVNLASEEEIWRENRKAITSESQVTPYSKLAELLGKKNQTQINLFVAQLMPLLKVLCSQRSSNFLRTRLVRSQCTGPGSANQWHGVPPQFEWDLGKICVGKTPKSEGGHIATYWNPHWNGTDIFRSAVSEPGRVKTWPWWYLSQYMGAYTVARLSRWCS